MVDALPVAATEHPCREGVEKQSQRSRGAGCAASGAGTRLCAARFLLSHRSGQSVVEPPEDLGNRLAYAEFKRKAVQPPYGPGDRRLHTGCVRRSAATGRVAAGAGKLAAVSS